MATQGADRITFRDDLGGLEDDETIVEDPQRRLAKTILLLTVTSLGTAFIIILLVFFQPEGVVMTESWPNGYTKTRATYVSATDEDGRVLHGSYRAWHENGQLAEEGRFADGEREGPWLFWGPGGQVDPRFSGTYVRGVRTTPATD